MGKTPWRKKSKSLVAMLKNYTPRRGIINLRMNRQPIQFFSPHMVEWEGKILTVGWNSDDPQHVDVLDDRGKIMFRAKRLQISLSSVIRATGTP